MDVAIAPHFLKREQAHWSPLTELSLQSTEITSVGPAIILFNGHMWLQFSDATYTKDLSNYV